MGSFSRDLTVESEDGTNIAVWAAGAGPPMLLVHGSFGDHTAWSIPLDWLSASFRTYALDRRGFGASDDAETYSIEDEFADVASVAEVLAEQNGERVILWGHSYGANCAMGGASRTRAISHLILYEPSFGLTYPAGSIEAAEALLEAGDRAGAVESMLCGALEMTEDEVNAMKASDRWPNLLKGAHTAPRECRVEETWVYRPGQFDGIAVPSLFLSGTDNPDALKEATLRAAGAIPGSVVERLAGHGHFAHRTDPDLVVEMVRRFVTTHR